MKDSAKAAFIFRTNCDDHRYGPSCHKFARLARRTQNDRQLGWTYDRQGCNYGYANSCLNAAMAILPTFQPKNSPVDDFSLAVQLLDRGCDLGCDNSCYLMGGLYLADLPDALNKNVSMTYQYDLKACQLGNRLACANLRGLLPVDSSDEPTRNGFFIRLMQLKKRHERLKSPR